LIRYILLFLALLLFVVTLVACAKQSIPEPESEGARLYVQYCSGSGCHDPIPPQQSSFGYWQTQYRRWSDTLRKDGHAAPNPEEDEVILAWLKKHARGSQY
jgi:hypothetical protein